ncbi:uncharacterized protein B4U80_04275 [Leptotrombidium deliense]|uniref:MH2 domain-containing protein n=1 Tax=Leptotrombidium deliense TaxID=299467 RepID=A0A443SEC8_9ACAR|nr:uncharacterized protein B4U80_04275 [Leptotrombidium deliense]
MERNRRIAKAYARAPVLSINGSEDGFDGYKIGLNGFESPVNDTLVKRVKRHIGQGVRIKIDETGNVIVKRQSNCDVFIGGCNGNANTNSTSKDALDLNVELEYNKSVKLFDMKKFQSQVNKELRSAYPDRRKLENHCISVIAFVKDAPNILDLPVWCLIINIVALDMLKSKLPPTMSYKPEPIPKFLSIFDRQEQQEEDPYSVPSLPANTKTMHSERSQSMRKPMVEQKPPELPPRDLSKIKKQKENRFTNVFKSFIRTKENTKNLKSLQRTLKDDKEYEDPYYCGMRARLCNNNNNATRTRKSIAAPSHYSDIRKSQSSGYLNSLFNYPNRASSYYSYYDSSFGINFCFHLNVIIKLLFLSESDPYAVSSTEYDIYGPIYGRIRNNYVQSVRDAFRKDDRHKYATQWD